MTTTPLSTHPSKKFILDSFLDSAAIANETYDKSGTVEVTLMLPVDGPGGYKAMLSRLTGKGDSAIESRATSVEEIDDKVLEELRASLAARSPDEMRRPYGIALIPFDNQTGFKQLDLAGIMMDLMEERFRRDRRFVFLSTEETNKILLDNNLDVDFIRATDVTKKMKIDGVDGLVDGVILRYEPHARKHGIGGTGYLEMTFYVEVDLRVLDA